MRKVVTIFSLVVVLIWGVAFNAEATPIVGDISFSGSAVPDNFPYNFNTATAFTGFSGVTVQVPGGVGAYSPLTGGTPVTFTPFAFRPFSSPVPDLWHVTVGPNTYSFDATSLTYISSTVSSLTLEGLGTAHITGFDATAGSWTLVASSTASTATFSSSASVPEPSTLLLMGSGLLSLFGLLALRKKLTG